jgi:histidinol-phosphatase
MLTDSFLDQALSVARAAAARAEVVVSHYYRGDYTVEIKEDASPVTIADREAEQVIRATIAQAFPEHGFYGEEFGHERPDAEFLWLIDPIDGTKAFVRGYPMFSTQIALMHRGELVVGVSSAGQFGETAWARRGGGAFINGQRVHCGKADRIENAQLSIGNVKTLAADERWLKLACMIRHAWRTRGYGDFYHYHLLARGGVDAVIESDVNILDIAALAVIVREAGAVFTNLDGGPLDLHTKTVLAATPLLHGIVREGLGD